MSEDELRKAVLNAISEVAPEIDVAHLDGAADLREAIELDSMDARGGPLGDPGRRHALHGARGTVKRRG